MSEKERLLEKSISENSVRPDLSNKNYTSPGTYGVYEILHAGDSKTTGLEIIQSERMN